LLKLKNIEDLNELLDFFVENKKINGSYLFIYKISLIVRIIEL